MKWSLTKVVTTELEDGDPELCREVIRIYQDFLVSRTPERVHRCTCSHWYGRVFRRVLKEKELSCERGVVGGKSLYQ